MGIQQSDEYYESWETWKRGMHAASLTRIVECQVRKEKR